MVAGATYMRNPHIYTFLEYHALRLVLAAGPRRRCAIRAKTFSKYVIKQKPKVGRR